MTRIFLVVPLLGLALAGCGGSDSTGGTPDAAAPLTKQAYVEQAGAICDRATTELKALPSPTDAPGFTTYLHDSVAAAKRATDELTALKAPEADATELRTKFTEPLSQQVTAIEAVVPQFEEAAKAPDPTKAFAKITRPQLPQADPAFLASYGLTSCAALSQGSSDTSTASSSPAPSPS